MPGACVSGIPLIFGNYNSQLRQQNYSQRGTTFFFERVDNNRSYLAIKGTWAEIYVPKTPSASTRSQSGLSNE